MKASFGILLPRLALPTLASLALLTTTASADDTSSSDHRPGFFARVGHAILSSVRRLERSDAPDYVGHPVVASKSSTAKSAQKPPVTDPDSVITDDSVALAKTPADLQGDNGAVVSNPAHVTTYQMTPVPATKGAAPEPNPVASSKSVTAPSPAPSTNASADPKPLGKDYPMGTQARKYGFVKSPYPPFNELDATGLVPGSLARDPTTGKIFRIP